VGTFSLSFLRQLTFTTSLRVGVLLASTNDLTTTLTLVFGVLVLAWSGLFTFVVSSRAIWDAQHKILELAGRGAHRRLLLAARASGDVEVDRLLRRLRTSTLLRAASDASTSTTVARVFAAHLVRRAEPRVRSLLADRRGQRARWERVAALRVLALAEADDALALLASAARDTDDEIAAAAVRILGELDTSEARGALVHILLDDDFARSRVAAQLDRAERIDIKLLSSLLSSPDDGARYWGTKLLAHTGDDSAARAAALAAARDPNANVRAAAADSLGLLLSANDAEQLLRLLDDEAAHVRVHAARSLGALTATGAGPALAELLRDSSWWVRTAAKRALESLGPDACDAVWGYLDDDDHFARNGAAEVLQNIGVVRELVDTVTLPGSRYRSDAAAELAKVLAAGGSQFEALALEHLDHDARVRVRTVVESIAA
jgi:HEAT repeat protein